MSHRSRVYVEYRSGGSKPKGVRVVLSFRGFFSGSTSAAFTDRDGVCIIEHASIGTADVIVSGKTRGSFRAPGETVVYL